jgi:hypothetical protein
MNRKFNNFFKSEMWGDEYGLYSEKEFEMDIHIYVKKDIRLLKKIIPIFFFITHE